MSMRDTRRPVTDTVGCDNRCDNHPVQHRRDAKLAHVGRLERGESGVTVEALAAILAALGVNLAEFFEPFTKVMRPRVPRRRG